MTLGGLGAGVVAGGFAAPAPGADSARRGAVSRAVAPPTPLAPNPTTTESPVYFVPLDYYHELPADCYETNLIAPREIILHWDGNEEVDRQVVQVTFDTMKFLSHSSHFAVDDRKIWQMLPMYHTLVQESHGAQGYNWAAINVEMTGINFDEEATAPSRNKVQLTLQLVAQLMDYYAIPLEHIAGHFERDLRGLKVDPGPKFLADFRKKLQTYRATRSPLKQLMIVDW